MGVGTIPDPLFQPLPPQRYCGFRDNKFPQRSNSLSGHEDLYGSNSVPGTSGIRSLMESAVYLIAQTGKHKDDLTSHQRQR